MNHYADILRRGLDERMRANPRYSLRAYARDLGVSPSRLCEVLKGKQGLSETAAQQISARLGMSDGEASYFCALVAAHDSRSRKKRVAAGARLAALHPPIEPSLLKEDIFRTIADWYHYAILELSLVQDFKGEARWISRQLNVPETLVKAALDRLVRLGMLEQTSAGVRSTGAQLVTTDGVPSDSIRQFNRQILEKALESITLQSVDERDIGTLTTAIHTDDLPEIKALLKRQRRELNQLLTQKNNLRRPNTVYCLATQFFRLSSKGTSRS